MHGRNRLIAMIAEFFINENFSESQKIVFLADICEYFQFDNSHTLEAKYLWGDCSNFLNNQSEEYKEMYE